MNLTAITLPKIAAMLCFAASISNAHLASAVTVHGYPITIEQFGSGSAFYLGHTVSASTDYSTLIAGGAYTVQCNHPATLPVTGERMISSSNIGFGGIRLIVTIPQSLPALANITGWNQVGAETELSCNYRWNAFAQEGGFSIGAGGISFPVGNGIGRDGGTVDFTMYRGLTGAGGGGCGP
jgi:hypothetical protein